MATQKQIWTNGRKSCVTCISVTVYRDGSIIASSEAAHITEFQMHRALQKEFPDIEFERVHDRSDEFDIFMESYHV